MNSCASSTPSRRRPPRRRLRRPPAIRLLRLKTFQTITCQATTRQRLLNSRDRAPGAQLSGGTRPCPPPTQTRRRDVASLAWSLRDLSPINSLLLRTKNLLQMRRWSPPRKNRTKKHRSAQHHLQNLPSPASQLLLRELTVPAAPAAAAQPSPKHRGPGAEEVKNREPTTSHI